MIQAAYQSTTLAAGAYDVIFQCTQGGGAIPAGTYTTVTIFDSPTSYHAASPPTQSPTPSPTPPAAGVGEPEAGGVHAGADQRHARAPHRGSVPDAVISRRNKDHLRPVVLPVCVAEPVN